MNIVEVHTLLGKLGYNTTEIVVNPHTRVSSFTFFYQSSQWYDVNNEKGRTIFWPTNGIGECFIPKDIKSITEKFGTE